MCSAGMEYYGLWVLYRDTTRAHLFMVHLTTLSRLRGGHPTNRGSTADSGNKCDFPPSAILTLETTLPDRKLYRGTAPPVACTGQPLEHVVRGTEANQEDATSGQQICRSRIESRHASMNSLDS
jgi:hypothetical protein